MNYLHEKEYYVDLYDLFTIKRCLSHKESYKESVTKRKIKDRDMEIRVAGLSDFFLYFIKGEEYVRKEETINKWMNDDSDRQRRFDRAFQPQDVHCPKCNRLMEMFDKDSQGYDLKEFKVLYRFVCKSCKQHKSIFENGKEYIVDSDLCPKCKTELIKKSTFKKSINTTKYKCPNCGYKNTEIYDFDKSHKEFEQKEKEDKDLLNKYRSEFCLSEKDGIEYITQKQRMHELSEQMKIDEAKRKDPEYIKAHEVKKLDVIDLEKLLLEKMKDSKFSNLVLNNPELGRYVIVPFTLKTSIRKAGDAENAFKKFCVKELEYTNWRLMSDGVQYRMGYLTGRFKGYESEDELAKFLKKRDNKKPLFYNDGIPIY